jgi:hypothetical protein
LVDQPNQTMELTWRFRFRGAHFGTLFTIQIVDVLDAIMDDPDLRGSVKFIMCSTFLIGKLTIHKFVAQKF